MKRAALFASVPLAALALLTGCGAGATTATPTSGASDGTGAVAQAAPVATAHSAPTHGTTTKPATQAGDAGDGDYLFGVGAADTAVLKRIVKPCPYDGQKVIIQKVVLDDVTGDGDSDLIVGRTCSSTTDYWESTVEVFDGRSTRTHPKRLGTLLTDVGPTDAPWLAKLSASGRVVTVEAYGIDSGTTKACADIYFTYQYRYDGGTFKRVSRQVGNAPKCPQVG